MDVFEMRVSEYAGKKAAERIPLSHAVGKTAYIKDRQGIIAKMDAEIKSLKKTISAISDTESYSYQSAVKRLKKCYEIKHNCMDSIVLAKTQIATEKNSHIK